MRFSQRTGYSPIRLEVQRESIDDSLRNKLWSAVKWQVFSSKGWLPVESDTFRTRLYLFFFDQPIDAIPPQWEHDVRHWFFHSKWFKTYDFIEFVWEEIPKRMRENFTNVINDFLEGDRSAYRLLDGQVVEIVDPMELQAVEEAGQETKDLPAVRTHLRAAVAKLSDRSNPDYRNSIKESISAVESLCQLITGQPNTTLGAALKRLKDGGIPLHPALEQSWLKLYGYTNDANGIRHALTDESTVDFSEAKYMLVSCSAFVSHLVALCGSVGISLR